MVKDPKSNSQATDKRKDLVQKTPFGEWLLESMHKWAPGLIMVFAVLLMGAICYSLIPRILD